MWQTEEQEAITLYGKGKGNCSEEWPSKWYLQKKRTLSNMHFEHVPLQALHLGGLHGFIRDQRADKLRTTYNQINYIITRTLQTLLITNSRWYGDMEGPLLDHKHVVMST